MKPCMRSMFVLSRYFKQHNATFEIINNHLKDTLKFYDHDIFDRETILIVTTVLVASLVIIIYNFSSSPFMKILLNLVYFDYIDYHNVIIIKNLKDFSDFLKIISDFERSFQILKDFFQIF